MSYRETVTCTLYPIYSLIIFSSFLSHLLIAECDIGVPISVRPSTFTSKFGFLYISDSKECETLHINCH